MDTIDRMTRRRALGLLGGSLAATLASASGAAAAEEVRLRMTWWGGADRLKRTQSVLSAYQAARPGVEISSEALGWDAYWAKLATMTAGRNAPDLIQQDYRFISEYAERGALLALDPYVPARLDLTKFDADALASGRVNGKLYGVSLGTNTTAVVYNAELLDQLGIPAPKWDWTLDEFGRTAIEISKAAKGKIAGSANFGGQQKSLEVFLRQRGKQFYTPDGQLGFEADDIAEIWSFWDDLRKKGGTVSAEVQTGDTGPIDKSSLTTGQAAMIPTHSNILVAFQAANKSRLGIQMYPWLEANGKPGQYLKQGMLLSVSATTKYPEQAVDAVRFITQDPAALATLQVERGVPASSPARALLGASLQAQDKLQLEYVEFARGHAGVIPRVPPKGAGEIDQLVRPAFDAVSFGRVSVANGAKDFARQCKDILARA